jgi:alpha-galactosidase
VGHLWRTTGDIQNNWNIADAKEGKVWAGGVVINLDMQKGLEKYAGPDHWNDPDMLEVGNGVLTAEEEKAHFSLWCMLAAPLMAGNDIRNMSKQTWALLTNKEAIAIDQDALGKQGYKIVDEEEFEIFIKPLTNGDTAICFFNRSEQDKKITINWEDYKISKNGRLRDVWEHRDIGTTAGVFKATIPRHGVILLRCNKINQE